ncbi:ABC transporter permease [Mycoplasmopsis glycophila]|uniref:ABC-type transport system involved in multi-copper enzyme maturation, permease component n=1 Tax=Mycoplasmopsis glycophila TaxID=171285 RepID=A0A449AVX5_9BACT|nr:ABC transporter permease [Mycoplasmopsis glycophila]VEU70780.1 ABC-type transport system involved in multi-copper enzyme maturation, permease component [Mycoplasmopsis glycophila]
MYKQILNYLNFLKVVVFSKKITWILLILFIALNIIVDIVLAVLQINMNKNMVIFIMAFVQILFTIFYSSLIYVNIFKELEEEGLEILTLSKPLSRKNIYIAKTIFCVLFSLVFGLVLMLNNLFLAIAIGYYNIIIFYLLISFFSFAIVFNFFGSIASLMAYRLNTKIAMTLPFIVTAPLMIGGVILNNYSTSTANNFGYYLNLKYQDNLSGRISNTEQFYLNEKQDNFFIVPNGYKNENLSEKQKQFLEAAYNASNNNEVAIYSWLAIPYQFLDIFNIENQNIFDQNLNKNNLENVLYYNKLDSYIYKYKLNQTANLKLYNFTNESENEAFFLIPGALKNETSRDNIYNTNLIYARENANNFNIEFPEDKFVFAASDNLVGQIKWIYIKEVLEDSEFKKYAKEFFDKIEKSLNQSTEANLDIKNLIIQKISEELENNDSFLNRYTSYMTNVFNPNSIENKIIKTDTEKKIYLATALIYYLYFAQNNSILMESILLNDNQQNGYAPQQFSFQINNHQYLIGGYSSYIPVQEVKNIDGEDKIIIRYNLHQSDNYLFQKTKEVYELQRTNQIVSKLGYSIIWTLLVAGLLVLNAYKHTKKDYK